MATTHIPPRDNVNSQRRKQFRIASTADFVDELGKPRFADLDLFSLHQHSHMRLAPITELTSEIGTDQISGCNAVVVLSPRVTANTVCESDELLAICRFGTGYDNVDVAACTDNDVLLIVAPGTASRPVAEATVGLIIALTHHLLIKDRLVRTARWDDRSQYMGCELRERVLGIVGLGGIGRELIFLLNSFGMKQPIAYSPGTSREVFEQLGVRSVGLSELLSTADFVSINCPLNQQTRGLIGTAELRQMKPEAYLLNAARGGIVDEKALYDALKKEQIAGAAIDCFETEPVTQHHPLSELDNVILTPHSIAWTTEFFRDIGQATFQSLTDLSLGRRPSGVVNRELFDRESFRAKWARIIDAPVEDKA